MDTYIRSLIRSCDDTADTEPVETKRTCFTWRDYRRLNWLQQRYSLELIRWRNVMSPTEIDAQPKDLWLHIQGKKQLRRNRYCDGSKRYDAGSECGEGESILVATEGHTTPCRGQSP